MGTHPIFESDFDCLTEKKEQKMASRKKQGRFENDAGTALNPVFGSHELSQLGAPFGKELTNFNLESLFREGDGAIQAKFGCAFGEFKMPMGVEMMADEVVVCNMNNGTVEFVDFEGAEQLKLPNSSPASGEPSSFKEPSVATVTLENGETGIMILVGDKNGLHIYDGDGNYQKSKKPKCGGTIYGIVPLRCDGGCVQLVIQNGDEYVFERWDKNLDRCTNTYRVDLPANDKFTIRFSQGLGNTILLSDMNKVNQGIWNVDMYGKVRNKIGSYGEGNEEFIQAAGVCFDNSGNFLAICSKTSRIKAFRADGTFMCDMQFPEGAIQRPSDLTINDDGKLAVVSLTGQCFMFDVKPGDKSQDFPTRGPRPANGYSFRGGRGRGRGRGGGRGDFRGGGRGGFRGGRGRGTYGRGGGNGRF